MLTIAEFLNEIFTSTKLSQDLIELAFVDQRKISNRFSPGRQPMN